MTRRRSFHSREQISFQGETSAIATRPWPAEAPARLRSDHRLRNILRGHRQMRRRIEPVTAQVMITFRALMRTFHPLSNAWAS